MSNSNQPPFAIGQKVVALVDVGAIKKGSVYTVFENIQCPKCGRWHTLLEELPDNGMYNCTYIFGCRSAIQRVKNSGASSIRFAPYNPYTESVSEQLAKEAMQRVGDTADQPVREIKESVNN
jgi:hypothetical protein